MPLIVPGVMTSLSSAKDKDTTQLSTWQTNLLGKTLSDADAPDAQTFPKKNLPPAHRIIKPGDMSTTDHVPERMNIHVGEDGTVQRVTRG